MIFEQKRFAHSTVLCANDILLKSKLVFSNAKMSKVQSLSMRGWFSQPMEEPTNLSTNVLLDHEIPIKIQSQRTLISHILIWKVLESIKKFLKPMKISGKVTKQFLKSMKIHGNVTPNLETAAYLCASYAQLMRELCAKSYHAPWAGWSAGLCSSAAAENIDLWRLFGTLCFRTGGKNTKYT